MLFRSPTLTSATLTSLTLTSATRTSNSHPSHSHPSSSHCPPLFMRRLRRAYGVARLFNMEPKKSSLPGLQFNHLTVAGPYASAARPLTRGAPSRAGVVLTKRGWCLLPVASRFFCLLFWGLGVPLGCSRGGFRKSSCERVGPDNIHRPVGGLRRAAAAGWAKPAL